VDNVYRLWYSFILSIFLFRSILQVAALDEWLAGLEDSFAKTDDKEVDLNLVAYVMPIPYTYVHPNA